MLEIEANLNKQSKQCYTTFFVINQFKITIDKIYRSGNKNKLGVELCPYLNNCTNIVLFPMII